MHTLCYVVSVLRGEKAFSRPSSADPPPAFRVASRAVLPLLRSRPRVPLPPITGGLRVGAPCFARGAAVRRATWRTNTPFGRGVTAVQQ